MKPYRKPKLTRLGKLPPGEYLLRLKVKPYICPKCGGVELFADGQLGLEPGNCAQPDCHADYADKRIGISGVEHLSGPRQTIELRIPFQAAVARSLSKRGGLVKR